MARRVSDEELKKPAPPVAADTRPIVEALIAALREVRIDIPAANVTVPAAEVTVLPVSDQQQSPREWRFLVKRNKSGFIEEIIATAKEND